VDVYADAGAVGATDAARNELQLIGGISLPLTESGTPRARHLQAFHCYTLRACSHSFRYVKPLPGRILLTTAPRAI
jgi:hypothetical protein